MGAYESSIGVNINEHVNKNDIFHVFPNPCSGFVTFDFKMKTSGIVVIHIYDLKGILLQTIKEFHPSSDNCQIRINTNSLLKGVYYYQLITPNQTMNGKISVVK